VDNYFFKFSILHNHQLDFPHPVKSNDKQVVSCMRWPYNNRKDIGTFAIMEYRIERAECEAKQTGGIGLL
jgi:hypothetical protein